jgi:hypothetical protein
MKMGLLQGAQFLIIRIVNCTDPSDITTATALTSSLTLQDRGDTPTAGSVISAVGPFTIVAASGGTATGSEVQNFTFGTGSSDKLLISIGGGADQEVTLSGSAQTATQVCATINAATTDLTATESEGRVKITADDAADNLVIKAISNDAYSVLGLVEGTYAVTAGTDSLVIAVDGGADQEFTLTAGARTAAQIVTDLSTLTGATATATGGKVEIVSSTTGSSSSIQIQADSTADTPLGFDNTAHSGTTDAAQDTLTFESKNPGAWGNSLKIYAYDSDLHPDDTFDIRVAYSLQGGLNEYFSDLSMDPESERYVVNFINERSRLVTVTDEESTNSSAVARPLEDTVGTSLTGGSDGDPIADADYIGDELAQTGIYACDKTDMSIDIIIPGTTSISVLQALTAYCEDRGLFIAYANTPNGLAPSDAKDWRMGDSPYSHEAFNSHRLTLWFGRPLCYDSQYDSRRYISNLGHLASCLSKTTVRYDYSYAPVGPRRGAVDYVEGIDYNVAQYPGYQDMFADYGINSLIINRQQGIEGAMFWEQYTTQRAASALRDLNVVRFCTMVVRVLMPVLRTFVFEPNHPVTWREVHRTLEPTFQLWKSKFNIYSYFLQTDRDAWFDSTGDLKNATLNTGLEIDQGIYRCRALIQPTRAMRYVMFDLGVMRTGEQFIQYTPLKELPGWVKL